MSSYWEDYDGQDGTGFDKLTYTNILGNAVECPIEDDLEAQVNEIRRCNGASTPVRLLRSEG